MNHDIMSEMYRVMKKDYPIFNDLEKMLKEKYPSLSPGSLEMMGRITFGTFMFTDSIEEAGSYALRICEEKTKVGKPWAVKMEEEFRDDYLRTYNKARAAGTDPVEFIRFTYGIPAGHARKVVQTLEAKK